MRHTTTALLAAACLALAGCSSGGEPKPKTVTVTASASPSLSEAEARQACVDGWYVLLRKPGESVGVEDRPVVCEGLVDQAGMYAEALFRRNDENRARFDACTDDPACTDWPVP